MPADHELRTTAVGVLGGTGSLGKGLARRLAAVGVPVMLGSRDSARAEQAAAELGSDRLRGVDNRTCARAAEIAIVAVPWPGHAALLSSLSEELADTVVVDCVNPLGFDERGPFALSVDEGSAAAQAQTLLPRSRVVAAFNHVSAEQLNDSGAITVDTDVLVLGDDREATDLVRGLADLIPGMRGVYAGRLRNAGQVEALAANLIAINRRYRIRAGIRVTGL